MISHKINYTDEASTLGTGTPAVQQLLVETPKDPTISGNPRLVSGIFGIGERARFLLHTPDFFYASVCSAHRDTWVNAGMVNGSAAYFIPPRNARFFAFSRENARFKKSVKYKLSPEINHGRARATLYESCFGEKYLS
jgi:hypothetical protein